MTCVFRDPVMCTQTVPVRCLGWDAPYAPPPRFSHLLPKGVNVQLGMAAPECSWGDSGCVKYGSVLTVGPGHATQHPRTPPCTHTLHTPPYSHVHPHTHPHTFTH